jgi:hypothetical protein
VTEDLGYSYVLARRTTSLGSIIETVLFAGQPIRNFENQSRSKWALRRTNVLKLGWRCVSRHSRIRRDRSRWG